jgi:hypothetical protein
VFTILAVVEVILLALKLVTKQKQISRGRRSGDERVSGRAALIDASIAVLLRQQQVYHGLDAS